MSALFPTYARFPITLVKGEGSRLWDDQGKEYLDFISGIAVTNLGHANPQVKQKLVEQLDELWHVSNLFQIPGQEKLAQLLTQESCADAVFFCNSGAEANEAAIKLARKYNQKVLDNGRYEIITFQQSFHGRTLATLTATGQEKVQEGFSPLPQGFVYAPYNDADALEGYITDKTCAIMVEMIQGEGGVNPAKEDFVQEINRLCKKHNLLLIADEIQTGMGRTGKLFAYEHYYGIEPDIFTLAKGLGNGFPIGAMLGKKNLIEAFGPGSHGSTFGGTPIASAAATATLEIMLEEKLPERAAKLGESIKEQLTDQLAGNPLIKEIRGKGLLIGIECTQPVGDVIKEAQQQGLLVISAGPQVIRLLPNLLVTEEDLNRGIGILCAILAKSAVTSV
jgi:acetylornithine/N-succinyldiaminopimelate aminotransferase